MKISSGIIVNLLNRLVNLCIYGTAWNRGFKTSRHSMYGVLPDFWVVSGVNTSKYTSPITISVVLSQGPINYTNILDILVIKCQTCYYRLTPIVSTSKAWVHVLIVDYVQFIIHIICAAFSFVLKSFNVQRDISFLKMHSPNAPIPSASGFGGGLGCLNTFWQGIWSTRVQSLNEVMFAMS